ncbi:hypothetical protein ACP70R_035787 [Stipagrostis hirtigluma subsp. patula]
MARRTGADGYFPARSVATGSHGDGCSSRVRPSRSKKTRRRPSSPPMRVLPRLLRSTVSRRRPRCGQPPPPACAVVRAHLLCPCDIKKGPIHRRMSRRRFRPCTAQ